MTSLFIFRSLKQRHQTAALSSQRCTVFQAIRLTRGRPFADLLGKGERGVHSLLSPFRGIPNASDSFFLEFDDDLSLLEPFGESLVLPFQLLVLLH